jgi:signal transduction histidine kinase
MSAASPTESAVVSRVDLDLVGVAAAVLDYSDVLDRLSRLSGPLAALEDPWVVRELASLVTVRSMNTRATRALGMDCETPAFGHVSSMFEVTSGMLESFKAQFTEMLEGSLTSQTEQSLPGERFVLVDWRASDASYRNVVVTLRDVTAARRHAEDFAHQGGDTKSPIDLNATIDATVAVARNEWKCHCAIELDLDAGLPSVPALAGPLKQALLAIVINAAQAVQEAVADSGRKGTIAISTSQVGDSAVLKITDSGGGIPQEIQDRIFDSFFTTKEVGRGSGQGLTICRSAIVDQHGGRLEFETEPGVGTTFIVSLPLHIEEDL